MTGGLDRWFRRSSRAARLRYSTAGQLVNVGTRITAFFTTQNSSSLVRQPMHSLDQMGNCQRCFAWTGSPEYFTFDSVVKG